MTTAVASLHWKSEDNINSSVGSASCFASWLHRHWKDLAKLPPKINYTSKSSVVQLVNDLITQKAHQMLNDSSSVVWKVL